MVDHASGTPTLFYIHTDQVAQPQKMTDANGSVVWDRVATPFGVEVSVTGSLTQVLRFPGQTNDPETSLNQNWHREYAPELGRYVQSDPIGLLGGVNTYAYVAGNPLKNADWDGLSCFAVSGGRTRCSFPGGPSFELPTPEGFQHFDGTEFSFHSYNVPIPLGDADAECVMQKLIDNPTPGDPNSATSSGIPNNAIVLGQDNPVTSFVTNELSTGQPVVVNMTGANSFFRHGYVARTVEDGYVRTYGEGTNWKQSPELFGGGPLGEILQDTANNFLWGNQMREFIEECTCGNK